MFRIPLFDSMPQKPRLRADQLAFEQGLAESREKARSLIMAGRIIIADSNPPVIVPKPGHAYPAETRLALLPGQIYASRGAYKLLTILDGFNLDVSGMVCLDAGASTGGFTDCLLQKGAAKVYAVDVGKNQLHEKLRADPRVINMEGINLRYADASLLPEKIDLLTGDLSFISLTLVLPACARWLKPYAHAALLIKPQFELEPAAVARGVVRRDEDRQRAVTRVVDFCQNNLDWQLLRILPAAIRGPKGNQEYMALFRNGSKAKTDPENDCI